MFVFIRLKNWNNAKYNIHFLDIWVAEIGFYIQTSSSPINIIKYNVILLCICQQPAVAQSNYIDVVTNCTFSVSCFIFSLLQFSMINVSNLNDCIFINQLCHMWSGCLRFMWAHHRWTMTTWGLWASQQLRRHLGWSSSRPDAAHIRKTLLFSKDCNVSYLVVLE